MTTTIFAVWLLGYLVILHAEVQVGEPCSWLGDLGIIVAAAAWPMLGGVWLISDIRRRS